MSFKGLKITLKVLMLVLQDHKVLDVKLIKKAKNTSTTNRKLDLKIYNSLATEIIQDKLLSALNAD